jgi:hypothetical protein
VVGAILVNNLRGGILQDVQINGPEGDKRASHARVMTVGPWDIN